MKCKLEFVTLLLFFSFQKIIAPNKQFWTNSFKNKRLLLKDVFIHESGEKFKYGFSKQIYGTVLLQLFEYYDISTNKLLNNVILPVRLRQVIIEAGKPYDVEKLYAAYMNELKNRLCINIQGCGFTARDFNEVNVVIKNPEFYMQFIFIYQWCTMAWQIQNHRQASSYHIKDQLISMIQFYCPNPCMPSPCKDIEGVISKSYCKVTGTFKNDFKCKCSDEFEWDDNSNTCQKINPCLVRTLNRCDRFGTHRCEWSPELEFPQCICKTEYMGSTCQIVRDACTTRYESGSKNGEYYCNVKLGNICIPHLGSNTFHCQCTTIYTLDRSLSEDNCLNTTNPCDRVTCLNGGRCQTSQDMTQIGCACPTGFDKMPFYSGRHCEIKLGVWSLWTQWSPCQPVCGKSRYKWKKRKCIGSDKCYGLTEEIGTCDKIKCRETFLSGFSRNQIVNIKLLLLATGLVILQFIISSIAWDLILRKKEKIQNYTMKLFNRMPNILTKQSYSTTLPTETIYESANETIIIE